MQGALSDVEAIIKVRFFLSLWGYEENHEGPILSKIQLGKSSLIFFSDFKGFYRPKPKVHHFSTRILQHTTDAFFSLPAFVTSSLWSRKNPVFLYSFEHVPKKSPAAQLFAGVPLFSNNKKDEPKKGESFLRKIQPSNSK